MNAHRIALACCIAWGAASLCMLGCEKTTEEKTSVSKTADGGVAKDKTKVTVSPDGKTVTKTEEHTVEAPKTPVETKDSTKVTVSPDGKTVTKTEEHKTNNP